MSNLQYRILVLPPGQNISALAFNPKDSRTVYAGAATGGAFNSTDRGLSWRPVFDNQAVLPVGDVAAKARVGCSSTRWREKTEHDLNKDDEIRVSELRDYMTARMQKRTHGRQTPTSRRENLEFDFRMFCFIGKESE